MYHCDRDSEETVPAEVGGTGSPGKRRPPPPWHPRGGLDGTTAPTLLSEPAPRVGGIFSRVNDCENTVESDGITAGGEECMGGGELQTDAQHPKLSLELSNYEIVLSRLHCAEIVHH